MILFTTKHLPFRNKTPLNSWASYCKWVDREVTERDFDQS
jgi:hypothetical protein